jgi:hypothetical protein
MIDIETPQSGTANNSQGDIFVIRMTSDHRPFLPARWRATVLHVRSGERRLVSSYDDLNAFIEEGRRLRTSAG